MSSAAEQLVANLNLSSFSKAKELKKRIWFTLCLLLVYRIGTYVPLPGIDSEAFMKAFAQQSQGVFGMFNMLAGGAVERMAIFALGIMPYISASIIMQLMTSVVPSLESLKKEGESGRKIINQYTRYATVFLAIIQSLGLSSGLQAGDSIVRDPGMFFTVSTVITLTGGTMFLMWLGEQITSRGLGNGVSLIIFSGIVAGIPGAAASIFELGRTGALPTSLLFLIVFLCVALIFVIVFFERAQRRILIQYPKRQMGNRFFQGDVSHLPLKLNTSGVIPPIFASSLLLLPSTLSGFSSGDSLPYWASLIVASLGHGRPMYMIFYSLMIVFFAFFYTAIVFNPDETADQLKKHSGFIPGYRPGERTAEYIDYVLTRITVVGALYLVVICLLPEFLISATGIPFYLGGTSLLIVVSVTLDTVAQTQGYLISHQYEGLIKKSKLHKEKRKR